jgi:hypothetical protein
MTVETKFTLRATANNYLRLAADQLVRILHVARLTVPTRD